MSCPIFRETGGESFKCSEDCTLIYYENSTRVEAEEYVSRLKADGYILNQQNETDGNLFALLTGEKTVTVFYTPCDASVRVTCSDSPVPPVSDGCKGEKRTTFFAFENDQTIIDCGMCLLVQCPDSSFFVVDSGHYFQMNDNDRIHKFMRERTPDGRKIVINGWLVTHGHTDHISKLIDFLAYNTDDVIIEGFYHNLLPPDYPNDEWCEEEKNVAARLLRIFDRTDIPVYRVHTGQRFSLRNLSFEVMSTFEDVFPDYIEDYNDSSCAVMLSAEGSRVFIPGDAAVGASGMLEKRFPAALACDIVQVSHHGHTGLSAECYRRMNASAAVFPVTEIMHRGDMKVHEADRVCVSLAKENYVTGNGTVCIPLPYSFGDTTVLPDETLEDFGKIKRIWHYVYPEDFMQEIYDEFIKNGGRPQELLIPARPFGWIEPKPPIEE